MKIDVISGLGKHASKALLFILEKGTIKKSELAEIMPNPQTYGRLVTELDKAGLVEIKEEIMGRKTYVISLTPKGHTVANSLMLAEDAAQGEFEIGKSEWEKQKKRWEDLSALTHVNVLYDHITFMKEISENPAKIES